MSIKERTIQTKEEILMYAAAMLYANNEEFPYEVRIPEEVVMTEIDSFQKICSQHTFDSRYACNLRPFPSRRPAPLLAFLTRLRILRQEETCERMIEECSGKLQLSYEEARERVELPSYLPGKRPAALTKQGKDPRRL